MKAFKTEKKLSFQLKKLLKVLALWAFTDWNDIPFKINLKPGLLVEFGLFLYH